MCSVHIAFAPLQYQFPRSACPRQTGTLTHQCRMDGISACSYELALASLAPSKGQWQLFSLALEFAFRRERPCWPLADFDRALGPAACIMDQHRKRDHKLSRRAQSSAMEVCRARGGLSSRRLAECSQGSRLQQYKKGSTSKHS